MNILRSIVILLLTFVSSCRDKDSEKLTIAVAANMQFTIEEIIKLFTETTGIACETVISSSGKLTAQISEGAPFDVFVSADMKYPMELFRRGLTTSEPEIYAHGKLVLWSVKEGIEPSINLLLSDQINHIALANPMTAPYGVAAVEALKHHGIYEEVVYKLVYGESISQTNQFIISKAAEIGFTAQSVVVSPEMKEKGKWAEVNTEIHSPIFQSVVIINNQNKRSQSAQRFYDFLFSQSAKEILNKFGYSVDN